MKLFKTEEHADVAMTLSNMASILLEMGERREALEYNQRVYG
jgi:hypothetical protein